MSHLPTPTLHKPGEKKKKKETKHIGPVANVQIYQESTSGALH